MAKYKDHLKGSFAIALEQAAICSTVSGALGVMQQWALRELGDKRRKVSDENVSKILSLAAQGVTGYQIAGMVGCSAPTVRRIIREHGIQSVASGHN